MSYLEDRKFRSEKVMFPQVSVSHFVHGGRGGWVSLVLCPFWGWVSLVPGSFWGWGGYVQGDVQVCPGRWVCLGIHPLDILHGGTPHEHGTWDAMRCWRYASYWNAFLFHYPYTCVEEIESNSFNLTGSKTKIGKPQFVFWEDMKEVISS